MTRKELDAEISCARSRLCFVEWSLETCGQDDRDLKQEARACRTVLQIAETYRSWVLPGVV